MNGVSFYKEKLTDKKAVWFTREFFDVKNDGSEDVSEQLQNAIYSVVKQNGYGVLFVPEGKYLLSRTIYIPKAVRLIGYGQNRPEFILKDNAQNFDKPDKKQKGGFRYLFWFVNMMQEEEALIEDANPGTFYSAISNINVSLGQGNDYAVAFRTHYAQHSFINHIDIHVHFYQWWKIWDYPYQMFAGLAFCHGGYQILRTGCRRN